MSETFKSLAPHHRECPGPSWCECKNLFKRDAQLKEDDQLEEAYREFYDPDWGNE